MRRILIAVLGIASLVAQAQQAEQINFEETTHDFGIIKEADGAAEYEFKFVNNSPDTLKIEQVKASCGCTTPGWTKEPIAPGGVGYVKAKYNTTNRPGSFNKSLTVTTNLPSEKTKRLYIKGQVTPKPKSLEEEYAQVMGGLRVKYSSFNMGKVLMKDQPTVKKYEVYNATDSAITFLDQIEKPSYINISFEPQTLATKAVGNIIVSYDGKNRDDYGFVSDNVVIHTDEALTPDKSFSVYATIQEDFSHLTAEERENAPVLSIDNPVYDFGKIQQGTKQTVVFTLTNTGKSNLDIRKVKSTCGCVITKLKKKSIKPGKSTELELIFDSTDRRGIQQKSVSIFTNDPKRPAQRVTVKASVQQ